VNHELISQTLTEQSALWYRQGDKAMIVLYGANPHKRYFKRI